MFDLQLFATTSPNANLVREAWAKSLWLDVAIEQYFQSNGFIGESNNSIIVKKTDLTKAKGDTIHIGLTTKLSGAGVTGDSTLEGNEEAISGYEMSVTVDQLRHAVRLAGLLAEQQAAYNMRADAKDKLKIWLSETLDSAMFTTLATSPSTNRKVWCSEDHSTIDTLDATDKMACTYISEAKRLAMLASPKVRPIKINGKPHYVLVIHPYAARDLKADTVWLDAQKYANVKGSDNPLFTGALGVWDGVIVHEHEYVPRAENANDPAIYYATNLFLGAGAGVWGIAKEPFWKEKDFDYDNQAGFATGLIHGFEKAVFNSEDYGVIAMYSAAVND